MLRDGTFRGVGLGDSAKAVRRALGRPRGYSDTAGYTPLGDDSLTELFAPPAPPTPSGAYGDPDLTDGVMRYRGVTFSAYRRRVYEVLVSAGRSRTETGVAIGDPLARARERHPGLRCGVANEGAEWPESPYCTGKVARRTHVWFGGDPIRSITIASQPLE